MNRRQLGRSAIAAAVAGTTSFSWAQTAYPAKTITMIVPASAAGSVDAVARLLTKGLAEKLGSTVPVVIDYKPGANLQLGEKFTASAVPDGHTLITTAAGHVINPALNPNMTYDPLKDLTGVFFIGRSQSLIVASTKVPVNTVQKLVAWSKKQPGGLMFANSGTGGAAHLMAEMFSRRAGLTVNHIPYKGAAPALTDLIEGRVSVMVDTVLTQMPLIKGGKVKALAVTGGRRSKLLPDVPTVAESGFPDFDANSWMAVLAPSATPVTVLDRLHGAFNATVADPQVRASLEAFGLDPEPMSREQLNIFRVREAQRWKAVVVAGNIKAE